MNAGITQFCNMTWLHFDEKSKGKWSINLISNAVFHWPITEGSELLVINLKSHDCKKKFGWKSIYVTIKIISRMEKGK